MVVIFLLSMFLLAVAAGSFYVLGYPTVLNTTIMLLGLIGLFVTLRHRD